ncbi:FecR domain-containing protein [Parasphingorhabdus litoris]|uniref:FecR domain-containing protein n=1 Tax=Parasphingorhabdus litoris TaxID=394733 RepID=A0ABN1A0T6_9SPHN|nr:FecR domain-containing protein [Parasphingorhabdus litoris]
MTRAVIKDMDVEEAAGFWDARLRAPDCSAADRAAHEEWKNADPAHAQAFDRLQKMIGELPSIAAIPEMQSMRAAALARSEEAVDTRPRRIGWLPIGSAIAASLAVIFGATLFFMQPGPAPGEDALATSIPTPIFATAIGERTDIPLSDGSIATLNTESEIDVRYSADERAIRLVKGEAHFEVAHNPDRPFVVYAGNYKVIAVGTAFDVKTIGDKVEVIVTEGKVAVKRLDADGTESIQSAATLLAGQQLSGRPVGPVSRRKADLATALSWRKGNAVFDDMPLGLAVHEMNRYSTVKLAIADPTLANTRINGMFITGKQDSFVEALEAYFGVRARQVSETEILLEPAAR